jgi:cephalosporin-C deacetylase-like acetyl esterase
MIHQRTHGFSTMRRARLAAVCTAFPLLLCGIAAGDHVLLQVEDFQGPWRRQTNIRGYLGTGFCTSNANPNVASTVMAGKAAIAVPGEHAVWVRAYTSGNSRRALQVEVAGRRLAVTHKGTVREWRWERAGEVYLDVGEAEIVVHDADDGFETADAVLITDRRDYDPMEAERQWNVYGEDLPERADALRFNIEACCKPLKDREAPQTLGEWEQRAPLLRRELARSLGLDPLPPRTPLNARVTGTAERELYTIENVIFESRPRFYVTANLYVPKNVELPAPGIVVVPGHAMKEGKNYPLYQMAQIGLARHGFVVLGYDPIGQGERQLPGFGHHLGYSLLLVGQTNEGLITWDTMRAIDYLCTRPEVDPERIGLTGNSGGGLNSLYAPAVDERINVAASFCFVCSFEQWLRYGGNHCICNHLPGIVRHMEQFEVVGLIAPRPFLMGNGAKDPIFPIAGTRDTLRRAKAIYRFHGVPERVSLVEADLGHGWSQPLREACYGWMVKWLQGRGNGEPISEEQYEAEPWDSPDLTCCKGEKMPEDRETLVTLAQRMGRELIERHDKPPRSVKRWQQWARKLRAGIWEVFGGKPRASRPRARDMGSFEHQGRLVQKIALTTEPHMAVPALLLWPEAAERPCPAVIFIDDGGKLRVRDWPLTEALLGKGVAIFAIDPRGLGEGQGAGSTGDYNHLASDTVVLGRPLLAQQAWDVMQAAKHLRSAEGIDPDRIACYGHGAAGLIALLAGALSDDIGGVVAEGTLTTYLDAIEDGQPQPRWIFAPGILRVADIPQVAALIAPRPVLFARPIGPGLQALGDEAAAEKLAFTREAFGATGRRHAFRIAVGDDGAVAEQVLEALGVRGPG